MNQLAGVVRSSGESQRQCSLSTRTVDIFEGKFNQRRARCWPVSLHCIQVFSLPSWNHPNRTKIKSNEFLPRPSLVSTSEWGLWSNPLPLDTKWPHEDTTALYYQLSAVVTEAAHNETPARAVRLQSSLEWNGSAVQPFQCGTVKVPHLFPCKSPAIAAIKASLQQLRMEKQGN